MAAALLVLGQSVFAAPTVSVAQPYMAPPDRTLATLERPARAAQLISIDQQWRTTFQLPSGRETVECSNLAFWGAPADRFDGPLMLLRGPGQLVGQIKSLDEASVVFESRFWRSTSISRNSVAGILFDVDAQASRRDLWLDRLNQAVPTDRVWLNNADFVDAKIDSLSPDRARIRLMDGHAPFEIELSKVKALVFSQTLPDERKTAPQAIVSTLDGSSFPVTAIAAQTEGLMFDGGRFQLELSNRLRQEDPWQVICGIHSLASPVTYLSGLSVTEYQHVPYLHGEWLYRMDRSVMETRIRYGGQRYDQGIGMHAKSSLVFALRKPVRRFDFGLAMDPSSAEQGSVVCRVLVLDAQNRWQTSFTSDLIRGGNRPIRGSVDMSKARALALTVDFADNGDILDRVNWIRPRLIEKR